MDNYLGEVDLVKFEGGGESRNEEQDQPYSNLTRWGKGMDDDCKLMV